MSVLVDRAQAIVPLLVKYLTRTAAIPLTLNHTVPLEHRLDAAARGYDVEDALAVAATACCRVNKLVSNRSSMETAKDCVPTSGRKEPLAVQGDSYTPSTRR